MSTLMEVLGTRKNSNAPLIYKIMANCFSHCGNNDRMSYIAQNLKEAFQSIKNLPGGILVDSLIKNI